MQTKRLINMLLNHGLDIQTGKTSYFKRASIRATSLVLQEEERKRSSTALCHIPSKKELPKVQVMSE